MCIFYIYTYRPSTDIRTFVCSTYAIFHDPAFAVLLRLSLCESLFSLLQVRGPDEGSESKGDQGEGEADSEEEAEDEEKDEKDENEEDEEAEAEAVRGRRKGRDERGEEKRGEGRGERTSKRATQHLALSFDSFFPT